MAHLKGQERATYVQRMFGQIAPSYDLINRLIAGGRDVAWRRLVVAEAHLPPRGRLLDIATGTGDIALEALRRDGDLNAIGADFSLEMMQHGRASRKPGAERLRWLGADTLALPFPDETFDAVTSGFMLRNVIDVPRSLSEQRRVVKPGGRMVCLEISRPPRNLLLPRVAYYFYFHRIVPFVGGLVSGNRSAYAYLPQSADEFLSPDELADLMRQTGWREVRYRKMMMDTVAIHTGVKG
jgi:demethylmenaquinone methyltransferase/2-methoxy-6-polyprenyl-1,4-benzoquinol methylase